MLLDLPVPAVGDVDLELDVQPLRLINVTRSGDGVVLRAVGSFPVGGAGGAGDTLSTVRTHVDISLEPHVTGRPVDTRQVERDLAVIVAQLQSWCAAGTPLRLLAAPGKHLALVAPDGVVLPLPAGPRA